MTKPTTFSELASLNDDLGGRFKLAKPAITDQVPQQPEDSPWHSDPVPNEEPLGYSIDDMPVVGEPHENVLRSASAPSPLPDRELEPGVAAAPTPTAGSSLRRRI